MQMQPTINTPKEKSTSEFKITDVVLYVSDADKERRKQIHCTPYIEGLMSIVVQKVYKRYDQNCLAIDFFIKNLSEEVLPFSIANAYYVTSQGEQIHGNSDNNFASTSNDFANERVTLHRNCILPHLKINRKIIFQEKITPNYSDVLLLRVKCHKQIYLLSTFVFQ